MADQEANYEVLYLTNEDNEEIPFEVLYHFENPQTGKKYMFLIPLEETNEDAEEESVIVLRYHEEGDDILFEEIETEEEWQMVEEVFNTLVNADL
jgi:uncharacterized protein YrzB (UPF0473 family)